MSSSTNDTQKVSIHSWNNLFSRTPLVALEYQLQRTQEANRQAGEVRIESLVVPKCLVIHICFVNRSSSSSGS